MIEFIINSNLGWGKYIEVKNSGIFIGRIVFHNDEYLYIKGEGTLLENPSMVDRDRARLERRIRSEEGY